MLRAMGLTGLRGSSLRFSPIVLTTKPGVPRQDGPCAHGKLFFFGTHFSVYYLLDFDIENSFLKTRQRNSFYCCDIRTKGNHPRS